MLKILLQAFFLLLKNNVNQNKRGFSVPSNILLLFFFYPIIVSLLKCDKNYNIDNGAMKPKLNKPVV
jgi:hypothetical protein